MQEPQADEHPSWSFEESDSEVEERPGEISIWEDTMGQQKKNRDVLNTAIAEICQGQRSPVRSTMNTDWDEVSQRQKDYYIKKAKDGIAAVFEAISPGQEAHLWDAVTASSSPFSDEPNPKKKLWDHPTLQSLIHAYNESLNSQTRKQILSVFADDYKIKELQDMIPGLSEWRIKQARAHAANAGKGQPVDSGPAYRTRLNPTKTDHFLEFISRPDYLQDVSYGTKKLHLESGETITIPAAIRTLIPSRIIQQYENYCAATDFQPLSKSTLHKIVSACAASQLKSLEGLDYITNDGAKAFDTLKQVADTLANNGADVGSVKDMTMDIKSSKRYLKGDYRVHVASESSCPDHCIVYALNDTTSSQFKGQCTHNHTDTCDRCEQLRQLLQMLKNMINNHELSITDQQRMRLTFNLEKASEDIYEWKAHILRTVNQEQAKQTALRNLDNSSILVVMDWAMKFLPRRYREAMSDFFGKRGKSWHVTAIVQSNQDTFGVQSIVHIFEQCVQNWFTVASILEHVLKVIKAENPEVNKAFLKSDNAGCYHNASLMHSLCGISERSGINISRYDFSDPQSGKDICDRKIAPLKAQIRRYINEKHDVVTASDMKEAIESHSGVSGVRSIVAEVDTSTKEGREAKWDGISKLNNFQFDDNGVRAWKAFEVGEGQQFPHKIQTDEDKLDTGLKIIEDLEQYQKFGFYRSPDQASNVSNELFSCTEAGCVASYDSEVKLQRHLDTGKHTKQLERESSYDTIKKHWAKTVTEIATTVSWELPGRSLDAIGSASSVPSVEEGWGLRRPKKPHHNDI